MDDGRPWHRHNVPAARSLRRSLTPSERRLWEAVRDRQLAGWKLRRQHPVGPFVLDFYCAQARLGIELDGAPHRDPIRRDADDARQEYLEAQGIALLRIPSHRVFTDLPGVLAEIDAAIRARLQRERGQG